MPGVAELLLAFVLGAGIGAEREWHRHGGGLRTCAIVAAASCGFTQVMLEVGGNNVSAAIGALTTGVGFLGAGVILRRGAQVQGISTAATFWAVAAIGAALGAGMEGLGVALFVLVLGSHLGLRPLSRRIRRMAPEDRDGPG